MSLQPTLQNQLVLLRPLTQEDYRALYKAANDPEIWAQHQNPDRWKEETFKVFFKEAINSKGALAVINKKSSKIIGSSRFKVHHANSDAIEIGWTFLSKSHWGGTYNKSFKTLMIALSLIHI